MEMVDILTSLHKYVPTISTTEKVDLPGDDSEIVRDDFFQILFGK